MFPFVKLCLGTLVRLVRGRRSLLLENLALRQQLAVLKRRHPRPSVGLFDKLLWVVARRVWSAWKHSLIIVTPETESAASAAGPGDCPRPYLAFQAICDFASYSDIAIYCARFSWQLRN